MLGLSRATGSIGSEILMQVFGDPDRTSTDPVKNLRGCYKNGDVIDVLPATKHNGNLATNPIAAPFWLIRVVGIPRAVADKYRGPGADAQGVVNRRRLHGIVFANLPAAIQSALTNTRYAVVPWEDLRLTMRNKVTGTTAV
jgi:hypothetical protein